MADLYDCRDAFSQTLVTLGAADDRVVVVNNDSVGSSKTGSFRDRFPDRLVNVGIAEQNMVGVGAGLANAGKIPFVCAASCFLTARALEQIKADVAYSNANVKLVGVSPGMAYGPLGATHHSIEDMAWLRALANMTVVVPADPEQTEQVVRWAHQTTGPAFIRVSRTGVPMLFDQAYRFEVGKADVLRDGNDITLIANGILVAEAMKAADALVNQGIESRVLNMATVQPIDRDAITTAARETGAIVTVEEHTVRGGLGSAVAEVVVENAPVPMKILGVPGVFAPTGSTQWLLEHFGLTAEGISDAVVDLMAKRRIHA